MIGELAALGAAISWTASALFYRKALQETKPIVANFIRLTCTSIILFTFIIAIGKIETLTELPTYALVLACVSGIIGLGFGDTLYMASLKSIGIARAVPITCTYPLFSLLWAVLFAQGTLTFQVVLGATAIFFGIWLISQHDKIDTEMIHGKDMVMGVTYALATAILWSVSITMMDIAITLPTQNSISDALIVNAVRVAAIAISLLILLPLLDRKRDFLKTQRKTVATLIAGGLVALGLGWFFLAYSFTQIPETQAVPLSSTTPLFSTLAGTALLHEKVTVKNALGSVIIVAGIFLIFMV
jgi:DME family drug/metabolite transporter